MEMNNIQQWRLVSGFEIIEWSWDDEYVIYNDGSGDTHLVDYIAARVLRHLQKTPMSVDELIQELSAYDDIESDDNLVLDIEAVLLHLHKANLVERSSTC